MSSCKMCLKIPLTNGNVPNDSMYQERYSSKSGSLQATNYSEVQVGHEVGRDGLVNPLVSTPLFLPPPSYPYPSPPIISLPPTDIKSALRTVGSPRRPRSEKKPIPVEQKDEKYYERRKRNNQAAKKSRDARRLREDHIALRASMLEHENAVLRAQVITLREEAQSLRQLLIHHKMSEPHDICSLK